MPPPTSKASYLPNYTASHALVIGINKYQHVSPLLHASNDAQAVARILVERFGFPKENVQLLLDAGATREGILRAFLAYAGSGKIAPDDRILVFFAGHGHTVPGRHGETGFLVPVDAKADELASLIRWDDLTRGAELIPAKHMLFLMDACYGGLALTRTTIPPGSMRFLKDMLQRYTRQVLTAGKGDEVVSDAGGTRPGHSIFTSHLLDGMDGAAASNGILTGHGVMAYVYNKVGGAAHSRQTPHFGFFDGDGDFIFDTSPLAALQKEQSSEPAADIDVYIKSPSFSVPTPPHEETTAEILKRLIAATHERIRLNDFVNDLIRRAAEQLNKENFPPHGPVTNEEFASRVQQYEDAISDLLVAVILLAHYADAEQAKLLQKIIARFVEVEKHTAGTNVWLYLAWYPTLLLMYAAGLSALAAGRYDILRIALLTPVHDEFRRDPVPVVEVTIEKLTEIVVQFKRLPDMQQKYVPRSEHIFKKLQPILEDQLFLGRSYDQLFDEFEMMLALVFGDITNKGLDHVWGPPGRFAWKERGRFSDDPVYSTFVKNVKAQGQSSPVLQSGFFEKSAERFAAIADGYAQLLARADRW
jgi:hypothetical protein